MNRMFNIPYHVFFHNHIRKSIKYAVISNFIRFHYFSDMQKKFLTSCEFPTIATHKYSYQKSTNRLRYSKCSFSEDEPKVVPFQVSISG